jgi:hypothetical protein
MGNDAAGRHHHGLLHGPVLRRRDLLLVLRPATGLRRRVARMAAGGSGGREGDNGERSGKDGGNNARHDYYPLA